MSVSKKKPDVSRIQVALLRGINVGPNKRVTMADLRALVEELGYAEARTLLNSGNVVFSSPATEPGETARRIEKALETKLALSVRVTVMSAQELSEVVSANPLVKIADNSSRLLVGIMADPAEYKAYRNCRARLGKREDCAGAGAPPRSVHVDPRRCNRKQAQRRGRQGAGRRSNRPQLGHHAEAQRVDGVRSGRPR